MSSMENNDKLLNHPSSAYTNVTVPQSGGKRRRRKMRGGADLENPNSVGNLNAATNAASVSANRSINNSAIQGNTGPANLQAAQSAIAAASEQTGGKKGRKSRMRWGGAMGSAISENGMLISDDVMPVEVEAMQDPSAIDGANVTHVESAMAGGKRRRRKMRGGEGVEEPKSNVNATPMSDKQLENHLATTEPPKTGDSEMVGGGRFVRKFKLVEVDDKDVTKPKVYKAGSIFGAAVKAANDIFKSRKMANGDVVSVRFKMQHTTPLKNGEYPVRTYLAEKNLQEKSIKIDGRMITLHQYAKAKACMCNNKKE